RALNLRDVGQSRNALRLELLHLAAANPRDERGMIVGAPLIVTVLPVFADAAVLDGIRIRGGRRHDRSGPFELSFGQAIERREIREAVGLLADRRDDMEIF